MLELTAENAIDYLRQRGWIGAGPAQAEYLSGGVSNQVLRITTPERRFVLKQSRPQLRTRDAWFSDLDRIWREQEVMQALHPHLPEVVPEVLHVDRANYVYAMSHAPLDATVWKADLIAGKIDMNLGEQVGRTLGRIHEVSAERVAEFQAYRDHAVYVQLRVEPFYRRVQERRPEVAVAIEPIINEMLTLKEALCHGDYTPKNILAHPSPSGRGAGGEGPGFTLVDYETAHLGDPTMDLGLFVAHLTLKAMRADADRISAFADLMRSFWSGYCSAVSFRPHAELEQRGMRHLGVCLLARIDGTSPVDYLPDEAKRDSIRNLGRTILLDRVKTLDLDLLTARPRPAPR